ncbi:hypothetical protein J6590_034708 [Homalodisca vitripennis]|nr:hypothetical protein J6590_034708 [Homalodisca vitripennis]
MIEAKLRRPGLRRIDGRLTVVIGNISRHKYEQFQPERSHCAQLPTEQPLPAAAA